MHPRTQPVDPKQPDVHPVYPRLISDDRVPVLEVDRVAEARAEPLVRGEGILSRLELLFLHLNRLARKAVPAELNPFAQLGAIATTTFIIALATGVLLLFWYSPSVHQAYASVERMDGALLAGLVRSLHRYSSDACLLFVLLHGFQILGARRFGGARWLGWVSGIALVGLLWFDGWTGYWLVWDERARQVALGTARFIDALPLFADPLSRSFLTNETVNSLFFFVIFFIHMMIPLAMGIGLWIHLMRLNKARFLTKRSMTGVILVSLVALSLLYPATSAAPADMRVVPQDLTADWFYLLPLYVTDRLQGGLLWALTLGAGVLLAGVPWWLTRRRAEPAVVNPQRCNGCTQCYQDCPFNAVVLLPCDEGKRKNPVVAQIDPAKCVGCGICLGSCDASAIDQTRLPVLNVRRWINHHAAPDDQAAGLNGAARQAYAAEGVALEPSVNGTSEKDRFIAFVCANSAGAELRLDANGESALLPGYRIVPVPCIGWVHMMTVERAFRRGAGGVLLVGCDADPACRKGTDWTRERLAGRRDPALRLDKVPRHKIRYVQYDRTDRRTLERAAAAFRKGQAVADDRPARSRLVRFAVVAVLLAVLGGGLLALSDAPYATPAPTASQLVISFKHAGPLVETANAAPETQDDLLPHMRRERTTERVRLPVRLRVRLDGQVVIDRSYAPGGLFNDGSSLAIETIPVDAGSHRVQVAIGYGDTPEAWPYTADHTLSFVRGERRVMLFDAVSGITVH